MKPKRHIDSMKQQKQQKQQHHTQKKRQKQQHRTRKKVGGFQIPRYKLHREMITVHDRRPRDIKYILPKKSTTHEIPKDWGEKKSMHLKGKDIVHGLEDYGVKYKGKYDIANPFSQSRNFSQNVKKFDFKILGGAWQNLSYFSFFFEVMNDNNELKWVTIFVNNYHREVCYYDSEGENINMDVWHFYLRLTHEANLFLFKQNRKLDQDATTKYDVSKPIFFSILDFENLQEVLKSKERIEPYRMLRKIIRSHHNNEEDPLKIVPYESESGIFALYFTVSMLGGERYEEFAARNLDNLLMNGFRGRFFKDANDIYKDASDRSLGAVHENFLES
jgi:hypothetical protein